MYYVLLYTDHSLILSPAKAICARTASDQVIMLENALMWQFVIIVAFQGKFVSHALLAKLET